MRIITKFDLFASLNEGSRNIPSNIIIGDSGSPLVDKNTKNASVIGNPGNESNLWKSGMGVSWLKGAVNKFPVTEGVKNVVIQIGTNGGFNLRDDIKGLVSSVKRVFPNAKLYVVQGSWGWGGNKGITISDVTAYYKKFRELGVFVVEPPFGYSATDREAHQDKQSIRDIGKNLDSMISGQTQVNTSQEIQQVRQEKVTDQYQDKNDSDSTIYKIQGDPYYYKIVNGVWFSKGPKLPNWTSLENNVLANQILDKRHPGVREAKYRVSSEMKLGPGELNKTNFIDGGPLDPEKSDPGASKKYNIHIIPDNLIKIKPNYRSAQMPLKDLKMFIEKYGIKNIIRLNGDGLDSRHTKSDPITTIEDEKNLAKSMGVNFQKLSSTKDQNTVNDTLSKGNTLIHCAHGADRTGGNVGGYFYTKKVNPNLDSTDEIWNYTTKYNGWNRMVRNNPDKFSSGGYLKQAQKFGVRDIEQAKSLAN